MKIAPTAPALPAGPRRPARGPLPYVMAAVMLVLLGMVVHLPGQSATPAASPTVVYPTLTPRPTDTPIVFPDSLLPPDLPPETAVAVMTGGTPLPTRPADLVLLPTPYPMIPPPTATPVPPAPTHPPPTSTLDPHPTRPAPALHAPTRTPPTPTPVRIVVWRYTSPGWVPAEGSPIHFYMARGDSLLGSAIVSGGPIEYELVTLKPWSGRLLVNHIVAPVLIAWTAPEDGDYLLYFVREDPNRPAVVRVDLAVYRNPTGPAPP